MKDKEEIRESIREKYASVAKIGAGAEGGCCGGSTDCCSGNCCDAASDELDISKKSMNVGYAAEDIENIPEGANMGLGCGNPVALAALKEGEAVLDLGSGGGFDCFLARRRVGDAGVVIGVDMTPDMILLARRNARRSGYSNVEFRLGEIEHLPVADETIDVILSNCVINLSVDKQQVIKEAYRVLKPGGRLSIADMLATQKLPEEIKKDLNLICSCVGGAENFEVMEEMLRNAGFKNIRLTPNKNSKVTIEKSGCCQNTEDYVASYMIEAVK